MRFSVRVLTCVSTRSEVLSLGRITDLKDSMVKESLTNHPGTPAHKPARPPEEGVIPKVDYLFPPPRTNQLAHRRRGDPKNGSLHGHCFSGFLTLSAPWSPTSIKIDACVARVGLYVDSER